MAEGKQHEEAVAAFNRGSFGKAVDIWFEMWQRGDSDATLLIGRLYSGGMFRKPDVEEAADWCKTAELGSAVAHRQLGEIYYDKHNHAEAAVWYRRAADQGDVIAQSTLGCMYYDGIGVPADYFKAFAWSLKAAEQGDAIAQTTVGRMYQLGRGITQDFRKAVEWTRKAANSGYPEAQNNLGWLLQHGLGAARSHKQSLHWYSRAAAQGHEEARERLEVITPREDADYSKDQQLTVGNVGGEPKVDASEDQQQEGGSHEVGTDDFADQQLTGLYAGGDDVVQSELSALYSMIGLASVKDQVGRLVAYERVQRLRLDRGISGGSSPSRHLVFLGNPGTGKTTVARILARIYHALGVLKTERFVETDRSGLVGGYLGQTAIKTSDVVESALDGVLFIDEAYSLSTRNDDSFGEEAVNTLIKAMEDHRARLVVIVAGYTTEMQSFLDSNPGLRSRLNTTIMFEDYSSDERLQILDSMVMSQSYTLSDAARSAAGAFFSKSANSESAKGNGRFVRNFFERCVDRHATRIAATDGEKITDEDLTIISELDVRNAGHDLLRSERVSG